MAFREKIAWLNFGALIVAYAAYFGVVGRTAEFGKNNLVDIIWSFGPLAVVHAIVVIVGSIAIAIASANDAKRPTDERDRAIVQRSNTAGYYTLLVGTLLVAVVMPFSEPSYKIVNVGLAVVVFAEMLRSGVILVSYRRGWHG